MVIWNQQFATGFEIIDQQHRVLIANVNHLEELLHSTSPTREECEFVVYLVDFLETYANVHFQQEEGCMAKYRCPARAQNMLGHENFLGLFRDYKQRVAAEGFTVDLLRKLHADTSSWINGHILKIDTQLRDVVPV